MGINLASLKAKIGPLPMWVWAVLVAIVAIGFYYVTKSKAALNNAPSVGEAATDPYSAFANYSAAPTSTTPTDQGASYETNQSWLAKAIAFLTGQGTNPLDAQIALSTYLNNTGPLSQDQAGIVSSIITKFGLPPDGSYGIPTVTPPVAKPPVVDPPVTKPPVTKPPVVAKPTPIKTNVPFGDGYVAATNPQATQWFVNLSTGKRRALSKAEVSSARARGYNYAVTPMSQQNLNKIPIG